MPNRSTPYGTRYSGLFNNMVDGTVDLYDHGTKTASFNGADLTVVGEAKSNSLEVVTGAVSIDEIAYTFPAADGASTTQLTTNGSGVLAWLPADDGAA